MSCGPAQTRRKLVVDATKASVGEDGHNVSVPQLGSNGFNNRIRILTLARVMLVPIELLHQFRAREPLSFGNSFGLEDAGNNDLVGIAETRCQLLEKDIAPQSVGPWFQDRPKTAILVARPESFQS